VRSLSLTAIAALCLCVPAHLGFAQQTVSANGQFDPQNTAANPYEVGVTPDGYALAQADAAIEQARRQRDVLPPVSVGVDANGVATADAEPTDSTDDSFGAQQILKAQQRQPTFVVTGGASVVYTDNVALSRRDTHDDAFFIGDAGISWMPRIAHNVEASVGMHASVYRYDKTSELDFQNLGFGAGIGWSPAQLPGVGVFARYDLTELFGRDGHQILLDNVLTLGAQKTLAFGRSHALTFGASGTVGLSDPGVAQRDQLGLFVAYHLQLARKLDTDLLYRPALHFYTDTGRIDFNQIVSWTMRYRFTNWAELSGAFTYGINRSDNAVFDYNVLTLGATAGVNIRF
jgi:hypothetical protein